MEKTIRRTPGIWRPGELRLEIEKKLNVKMPKRSFYYYITRGVIPPGIRDPSVIGNVGGKTQVWTDDQVRQIIKTLKSCMRPLEANTDA